MRDLAGGAADHPQDGVPGRLRRPGHGLGQGTDRYVRSLQRLEPSHEEQQPGVRQVQAGPGGGLGRRHEHALIDAGGDDADPVGVGPVEPDQVRGLHRGGRQDPVGAPDHGAFAVQADLRLGAVAVGQREVLDLAQRVEGRHQRGLPDLPGPLTDPAGEPVVAVHDVVGAVVSLGPILGRPAQDVVQELRQHVRQALLGQLSLRTGGDADQPYALVDRLHLGAVAPVTGEHVRLDALPGQHLGDPEDVDVHPTRVARTGLVGGRRVEADDRGPGWAS